MLFALESRTPSVLVMTAGVVLEDSRLLSSPATGMCFDKPQNLMRKDTWIKGSVDDDSICIYQQEMRG